MTTTSQGTDTSSWFVLIVGVVVIAFLIRYAFVMRKREQELRAMATRFRLQQWPDDSTPRDLSLANTPFQYCSTLFNVYEGLVNHRQVAVFDVRKKAGKGSWSRTIIAVRTKDDVFEGRVFGLETKQVNDWQLCYSPVGFLSSGKLMDIPEIEEILDGIQRYKAVKH